MQFSEEKLLRENIARVDVANSKRVGATAGLQLLMLHVARGGALEWKVMSLPLIASWLKRPGS